MTSSLQALQLLFVILFSGGALSAPNSNTSQRMTAPCQVFGELLSREVIIPGLYRLEDIYPSTAMVDPLTGSLSLWYGGWRNSSDFPHDKIFNARSDLGTKWTPFPSPMLKVDAAVNDPSVVYQAAQGRYLMFFSYQRDPFVWHGIPGNAHLDGEDNYLQVWVAESRDGIRWEKARKLIGKKNGYDSTAAWAPSAFIESDGSLSLYYHNDPNFQLHPESLYHIFRSRIDITGDVKLLSTAPVTVTHEPNVMGNVNVTRQPDGSLLMLYNEMIPINRKPLGIQFRAAAALSYDGGDHWQEISPLPLRPADTVTLDVAKPTAFHPATAPDEIWVFVGLGDQNQLQSGIEKWRFRMCKAPK
ncbi:MAG: exo-alpha-sialidase [Bdellovibrionales bacterium]|nr:exo-alpha-sialidase [Bdellovibrionales bacterium]